MQFEMRLFMSRINNVPGNSIYEFYFFIYIIACHTEKWDLNDQPLFSFNSTQPEIFTLIHPEGNFSFFKIKTAKLLIRNIIAACPFYGMSIKMKAEVTVFIIFAF